MNLVDQLLARFFKPIGPLPSGVYHYQSPADAQKPYRLHLRLEPDGTGILILNAHTVLHLNPTAAEYCYHLVQQSPQSEMLSQMGKRYSIGKIEILNDFNELKNRLDTLINTPDIDPVTYLGFDREEPYSAAISAPYRLDCALTYQTSAGGPQGALGERVSRELTLEEWKTILDKAWQAGIPHIIFTGGEPTLRPDLPELIVYTQQIGQVSGLLTDGLCLTDAAYLDDLLAKGLDHIMLVLDPASPPAWQALEQVLAKDIHVTVHLTLDGSLAGKWQAVLERLAGMGVYSLSLSMADISLKNELEAASHTANEHGLNLVWDLPVPYSRLHPMALESADQASMAEGAGKAWLYVEPDGDVLAGQGLVERSFGNLLNDSWADIWKQAGAA